MVVSRHLDIPIATHKKISSVCGLLYCLTAHQKFASPLMTQCLVSMDGLHVLMTTLSSLMELVAMLPLFGRPVVIAGVPILLPSLQAPQVLE